MLLLLLATLATAAPAPEDPTLARLSGPLRAYALADAPERERLRARHRAPPPEDAISVAVLPRGEPETLADALEAAGWEVEAVGAGVVQVRCPYEALRALAARADVARVREPLRATPKEVVTEGWDVVMLQDWHALGVTGQDVTVGVIDLGFAGWESLGADEFPIDAAANFQFEGAEESAHGAEVTEVLYDFAPDASYILGSFQTDAQLCEVLTAMAENGADVVNASVGFDNVWSTDGSSGLTQCIDQVVEDGVAVFVAAGNEAERYRSGALAYADEDGTIAIDGESEIWFDSDDGAVDVRFRWSETFGAARQDIDLTVYNRDGSVCGSSAETQNGWSDPFEQVETTGCKARAYAVLSSPGQEADLSGLQGWLYSASGIDAAQRNGESSLSLPGDTLLGLTVGAWSVPERALASYSSRGPTEDGRIKPDVVAPTAVGTVTRGPLGFEGTSASTPHAAGLGALWVSATGGHGESEALRSWMMDEALDLGEAGTDNASGAGLIQADELPELARRCGCASAPSRGQGWLSALALLGLRRRRR